MGDIEYRDTTRVHRRAPAAYTEIDHAADLVEVQDTLRRLVNDKGD